MNAQDREFIELMNGRVMDKLDANSKSMSKDIGGIHERLDKLNGQVPKNTKDIQKQKYINYGIVGFVLVGVLGIEKAVGVALTFFGV